MKNTVKALAVAATLSLAAAPVVAQNAGESMLMNQLMNEVSELGFDSSAIEVLPLNDLVSIATILRNSDDNEQTKRNKIQAILDGNAG